MNILAKILKSASKPNYSPQSTDEEAQRSEAKGAPLGCQAADQPAEIGPGPSKIPVLLYYISCMCCVLGVIVTINSSFAGKSEEDLDRAFILGSSLCVSGVILALIMNIMLKREHDRIVSYVDRKAREMLNDPNSRQNFNRSFDYHVNKNGPNGHH